jgi:hypothetical protein
MFQSKIVAESTQPESRHSTPTFWRIPARCLLLLMLALSAWSFALYYGPQPPLAPPPDAVTDGALYRAIAARVAGGESYYVAAPAEQRARHFPLRPVVTVRPPTLAVITAFVGGPNVMGWLLRLTGFGAFLGFALRFSTIVSDPPTRMAAIVVAALSIYVLTPIDIAVHHDVWAGMLIALSLAWHRPGRYAASIAAALLAVCIRELAAPFLIVMIFAALTERRWREGLAWTAAFAAGAMFLTVHWLRIAALPDTANLVSPGWFCALGWPWAVHVFSMTGLLVFLPAAIGTALVPVALVGWMTVDRALAVRASLWMVGMMCVFMVFGRGENYYWGALVAPLLPIGLAFAPTGLARIWRVAR